MKANSRDVLRTNCLNTWKARPTSIKALPAHKRQLITEKQLQKPFKREMRVDFSKEKSAKAESVSPAISADQNKAKKVKRVTKTGYANNL